jgi:hypothetical protein
MPMVSRTLFGAVVGLAIAGPYVLAAETTDVVDEERPAAPKPGVLFTGTALPTTPQQGQSWTPPSSKLPKKWISAVEELYRHGFADPRGCEYREVKLTCGSSIWGGSHLTETHAWVFPKDPREKGDAQRFAVTWDGIVYPVVEVGPPANLRADVETLIKKSVAGEKDESMMIMGYQMVPVHGHPEFPLPPEDGLVAHDCLLAIKTCLLFRLGEGELAERLWSTWKHPNSETLKQEPFLGDPYRLHFLKKRPSAACDS